MPNLWAKTSGKVYESFHGARTIDSEFNMKVEEVKQAERNMDGTRQLFRNFYGHFSGTKNFLSELYSTIGTSYDNNSPYWQYISEIIFVHQELERVFDVFAENIARLTHMTGDWDKYFNEIRANLKHREHLRFAYDHYDEKMEKLVKKRTGYLQSGKTESARFLAVFERVNINLNIFRMTSNIVKQQKLM